MPACPAPPQPPRRAPDRAGADMLSTRTRPPRSTRTILAPSSWLTRILEILTDISTTAWSRWSTTCCRHPRRRRRSRSFAERQRQSSRHIRARGPVRGPQAAAAHARATPRACGTSELRGEIRRHRDAARAAVGLLVPLEDGLLDREQEHRPRAPASATGRSDGAVRDPSSPRVSRPA